MTYSDRELRLASMSPSIYLAGMLEASDSNMSPPSSPPSSLNTVTFDALPGHYSRYIVMLTTQNGGLAYVTEMIYNDSNNLTGFSVYSEVECTVNYMVVRTGVRKLRN